MNAQKFWVNVAFDVMTLNALSLGKTAISGLWSAGTEALGETFARESMTEGAQMARAHCFPAGTKVLLASGQKKSIEDVHAGDLVISVDPQSGTKDVRTVLASFKSGADHLVRLKVRGTGGDIASIESTAQHLYWTVARGWVPAERVTVADDLYGADDSVVEVVGNDSIGESTATYNLEVDAFHSYFVFAGPIPVLVHNGTPPNLYEIVKMDGSSTPVSPFQRHELLQRAWAVHNGKVDLLSKNLGLALDRATHIQVNQLQAAAGLHDPAVLKGMAPEVNIHMNADILSHVGLPGQVVEDAMHATYSNAQKVGLLCP